MKLFIAGYYGCVNLGDEAVLEALLRGIRAFMPDADMTVLSHDPHDTQTRHNVKSIDRNSILSVLRAIRGCDAMIFGGGGLLQDVTSKKSLLYYLLLIHAAKFLRKKVVLLGQGIGPVKSAGLLKKALHGIDLVTVRDEKSFNQLIELKIRPKKLALTGDLALLLKTPDKNSVRKLLEIDGIQKCKPRMIGVSIRELVNRANETQKLKAVAALFDHLIKQKDAQVVFLIFKHPDDLSAIKKVMGFMKYHSHVLFRTCSPQDMLAIISEFDALIGMRLHSLIFSALVNVPCFGLSYDPKVSHFQKFIGRPYVDMDRLDGINLIEQVDRFIDDLSKDMISIEPLVKAAHANIDLLEECLKNQKINVLGVEIDNMTMEQSVVKAKDLLGKRNHHLIVTPNPEMIMAAKDDIELKHIINKASLAPPDGVGLMMAGRLLGRCFRERVAGIDLMLRIVGIAKEKGYKVFLLGGDEGVAEKAAKNLDANIVGTFQGYSKNDHNVIQMIKQASPDILFIGLGSPKQEKWAAKHMMELNVPLIMCVGGSLDVISGRVKRAPYIMRKAGFEWLWRLVTQPRRWKRMLVLPKFIFKVIVSRYGG